MHNVFLDERTAQDIDTRVGKVLRDLDNPTPPLRLGLVRELLELDRAYYSSSDSRVLEETVHRLKVAGKQVIKRPRLLLEVVRKRLFGFPTERESSLTRSSPRRSSGGGRLTKSAMASFRGTRQSCTGTRNGCSGWTVSSGLRRRPTMPRVAYCFFAMLSLKDYLVAPPSRSTG